MIPALDDFGRLPPGRHPAGLDEIHGKFVIDAPHANARQRLFDALTLWIAQARNRFGSGQVWLDGGFVTHKVTEPRDIDLLFIPTNPDTAEDSLLDGGGFELLTLQDLIFAKPEPGGHLRRHQTVGGLIDAYIAHPSDGNAHEVWDRLWSSVKEDGVILEGVTKGYLVVEV